MAINSIVVLPVGATGNAVLDNAWPEYMTRSLIEVGRSILTH